MKKWSFHNSNWHKPALRLVLVTLVLVCVPPPQSTAQQGDRQLKHDSTQQTTGAGQRRIALVIGNGAYQNTKPLKNPPNDATLLAATLRKLGFEVLIGTNKTQREMKQLIREFGQRLRGGGGVGLFYFAGHGVQARGHNYLVPVEADIQTEADLEDVAVDVNYVLGQMEDAQNALNIAILDACRNNPFARSFRSAQEGLAQLRAPTGTLIAYATAPDSVAADGSGANSPYAEELTRQMEASGVVLETMFRRVTEQVSSRTGGRQEPWISDNHKGEFYFSSGSSRPISGNTIPTEPSSRVDPAAVELTYWDSIKNSTDTADYKAYLDKYPNGQFAALARNNLRRLETPKSAPGNNSNPVSANVPDASKREDLKTKNDEITRQNARTMEINETVNRTFKAGNDALSAKNYDEAVRQYDEGLAADQERAPLWTHKAMALRARGVDRYNAAITASPGPTRESGLALAKADFRGAVDASTRAVQLVKAAPAGDPAVQVRRLAALKIRAESMRLFVSKVDNSQADAGDAAYQEYLAVETEPAKKEKAQVDCAQMLFDGGEYERAYRRFKEILTRQPTHLEANLNAGLALIAIGDKARFKEAASYLKRFIDLAPDTHPFKADAKEALKFAQMP